MLTKGATGGRRELLASSRQRDRGEKEGGLAQFGFGFGFHNLMGFGFHNSFPKVLLTVNYRPSVTSISEEVTANLFYYLLSFTFYLGH